MVDIITVIVVLILIETCSCYTHRYNESIFIFGEIRNYCDMKCGGVPHTLCTEKELVGPTPLKCSDNFHIYDFKGLHLNDDILKGLNGLRDRIAEKMQVSNMVVLTWDEELSLMSEIFLTKCKPFERNPCTHMVNPRLESRALEPRYYHVADNVAFRRSKFFPYHFVPSVLRDWYYEKNKMKPPKIFKSEYGDFYGELRGHNNFTRLANPHLSRVGCGIARFYDGYAMHCHFFPYFHKRILFERGPPATNCPNLFPLKGETFPNLCTSNGSRFESIFVVVLLCVCLITYGYRMFRLRVQGGLIFWQKWNW